MNFRPILQINGLLLSVLAAAMMLPAGIGYFLNNPDWKIFTFSAFITAFVGSGLFLTNRGYKGEMSIRQAFLFTASSWFIIPIFGALPLYYSDFGLTFADAYFEVVSGLTTTGATVIVGLDYATPELLLWRSIMVALGGIGIVVFAIAVLPMLRIGGMQLFKTESSEREKMLPRAGQVAKAITGTYVVLAFLCTISLWLAGMNGFDALCHAFASISTAGFSNYDASIGYFKNPAIEYVTIVFMLLGSIPFVLFFQLFRGYPEPLFRNSQVRAFLKFLAVVIAVMTIWLHLNHHLGWEQSFRLVAFNVVSIVTTTGFVTTDYSLWGAFAVTMFFMLSVVGGCNGSTTGGIKIFRFQVLLQTARAQIHQLLQPHGVFLPKYDKKPIPDGVTSSVMSFVICYAFCFVASALILSFLGLDYITSMSAAAAAISNTGPGLGPVVGPAGTYAPLSDAAKYVLSFTMIIGRLELFTVLVLFAPSFWRD